MTGIASTIRELIARERAAVEHYLALELELTDSTARDEIAAMRRAKEAHLIRLAAILERALRGTRR